LAQVWLKGCSRRGAWLTALGRISGSLHADAIGACDVAQHDGARGHGVARLLGS